MMRMESDLVAHCLAALEQDLDKEQAAWNPQKALGVVLAARGYPASYAKGEVIRDIPHDGPQTKVFHAGTQLDEQGQVLSNGGRVLCAVALGDTIQAAQTAAYELVDKIDWDGAYYRRDIGFKALK
jgi:phosphoribosylamine--glycine ligase